MVGPRCCDAAARPGGGAEAVSKVLFALTLTLPEHKLQRGLMFIASNKTI